MGSHLDEFKLFNNFPELVQRRVFDIAFEDGETDRAAFQLSLVSWRINHWCVLQLSVDLDLSPAYDTQSRIKPLVYRQLIFHFQAPVALRRTDNLLRTMFTASNLELCTRLTRFLFAGSYHHGNAPILSLFLHSTNLERLGWWFIPKQEKELQKLLTTQQHPCLRRLSISTLALPLRDPHLFSAPVFQNLTHLDIGMARQSVGPSSGAHEFGWRIPWSDLRRLEHLIHLHLDLDLQYYTSDPDMVASKIEEAVDYMLGFTPPKLRYAALLIPFRFIFEAIMLSDVESWRVYENLVKGTSDKRVVVGTSMGNSEEKVWEKMKEGTGDEDDEWLTREQAERLATFGKWMVPSPRGERLYRVCETRSEKRVDFWGEVEKTVERRNKEFYPNEPFGHPQIILV